MGLMQIRWSLNVLDEWTMHQKNDDLVQDSQHTHAFKWRGTTAIKHTLSTCQGVVLDQLEAARAKTPSAQFQGSWASYFAAAIWGTNGITRRCTMALRLQAVIRARLGSSNGATGLWRKMSLNGLCNVFKSFQSMISHASLRLGIWTKCFSKCRNILEAWYY